MKKIQHFFEALNQKLEGDTAQPNTDPLDERAQQAAAGKSLGESFAPVTQVATKSLDSIKSLISPVASKISAKVADVLHSTAASEAAPAPAPEKMDPQLAANAPQAPASTETGAVLIRSAAYQYQTVDEPSLGYAAEALLDIDADEDTAGFDGGHSSLAPPATPLGVPRTQSSAQSVIKPAAVPHLSPREVPLEPAEPTAAPAAERELAKMAEPVIPILSPEWVKTPTQPLPPQRKQKRELPVIDMDHIQRNLERSQRKLAIEGAKMPERKVPEPLPVIDPAEIRGRLQEIHGGKASAPSPQRAAPMSVPASHRAPTPEVAAKPAVKTAPQPEVIRVFKSGGISPQANLNNAATAIPHVDSVLAAVSPSIDSSAPHALAIENDTMPAWQAPSAEAEFYPLPEIVVAAPAPVMATAIAPQPTFAPPPAFADVVIPVGSFNMSQPNAEFASHVIAPMAAAPAATPTPIARPSQFLRPDSLSEAPARPNPAWRGEDGLCLPLELLRPATAQTITVTAEELLERSILIEEKLNEFKVKVSVLDAYAGPVITRFEVEPATGIRGAQVVNLAKDLARSLGLASVRVVETIPGKTCMGLELPNPTRQMIRLSEILSAPEYHGQVSPLTIALGKDISGIPVATDLAKTPHMLVAGTTGSGKSVGVNAMILSILFKATPDEVRFIMIDPKMLELSVYEGIPHLLAPVVTDMKLAANALNWCVGEMEKRYRLMSALGVRNLAGFNQKIADAEAAGKKLTNPFTLTPADPEPLEHLPMIVVVVDEFADLMMVAGKKIEELIARLAQKARAAGIHLILATQRPSVDVITGLIKANIPTRLAFQVSSKIDSRTILDQMGAEALLGQGDMLFLPPGTGYPQRIHGAFVDDAEVHCVVEYLKQLGEPNYIEGVLYPAGDAEGGAGWAGASEGEEADPLYDEAVAHVLRSRRASISAVQRQFRIGYNRAARLIEQMESAGIVSGMESNGNRTVLAPPGE